jgi:hypothetical protein
LDKNFLVYRCFDSWHTIAVALGSAPRQTRAHIAIAVFLRLTAMDVCCGPPSSFSLG